VAKSLKVSCSDIGVANLIRLVGGMTLGQWQQFMLDLRVCGTLMVPWVPIPKRPLPLCSVSLVILLETFSNNALASPFCFQTFFATDCLVLVVSAGAFVVLKCCLDILIKDILRDSHWS
jgi:hypothetical protein